MVNKTYGISEKNAKFLLEDIIYKIKKLREYGWNIVLEDKLNNQILKVNEYTVLKFRENNK